MSSTPADGDPTGVGIPDALADRVRESAAWLVAAFGAVAVLLVPGIQLADLGALNGTRLWIAIGSAIVAAIALGLAMRLVAPFLRSNTTTVAELAAADGKHARAVVAALDANPTLFQGEGTSVGTLQEARKRAATALEQAERSLAVATARAAAVERYAQAGGRPDRAERMRAGTRTERDRAQVRFEGARDQLSVVTKAVTAVESVARFLDLDVGFRRAAWRLVWCTVVVACAMVTLAVAAHPPSPGVADFGGAHLVGVDLSGTSLREASFVHATLTRVNLRDANLAGANLHGVAWHRVTCPDGVDSDAAGRTCLGHLRPDGVGR